MQRTDLKYLLIFIITCFIHNNTLYSWPGDQASLLQRRGWNV